MKRYGYHRTSTKEQHLDRGISEITAYCESNNLTLEKIYTDQQTGKNFNRPRYTILKTFVKMLPFPDLIRIYKGRRYQHGEYKRNEREAGKG